MLRANPQTPEGALAALDSLDGLGYEMNAEYRAYIDGALQKARQALMEQMQTPDRVQVWMDKEMSRRLRKEYRKGFDEGRRVTFEQVQDAVNGLIAEADDDVQ